MAETTKTAVWRTDGGDLVPDGHPDARFLVAAAGRDVPPEYADAYRKMAVAPADKAVKAPSGGDKAATRRGRKTSS